VRTNREIEHGFTVEHFKCSTDKPNLSEVIGMSDHKNLAAKLLEFEKELNDEYNVKAKLFLLDHKCHICGKVVAEKDSVWCHRWNCALEVDGMCECALEAHQACCNDKCPYFGACLDTKL
jgi:hypothetical protein